MLDYAPLIKSWYLDPVLFVRQVLGMDGSTVEKTIQPWQEEALRDCAEHLLISIRSGKGVGKTAFLAWVILWFMATRPDVKIPCTATSQHQLYDVLWSEIALWIRRIDPSFLTLLPYEWSRDRVVLNGNFAVARTSRLGQPEALQGFHAKNVLMIVDEAAGVDDEVFKAAEGGLTTEGARMILTGNPNRNTGYFFETHHRDRGRWKTKRVSCEQSPLVQKKYIDDMRTKWGDDSNEFRVGVLGEFPLGGTDTIIPLNWVESAVMRDINDKNAAVVWGLDVARFGSDRTALCKRQGRVMLEKVQFWQGKDLMQTCGIIADQYFSCRDKPVEIMVDVIGYGAGVVDRLRELRLPVRGVNVAERKSVHKDYLCLRDELWFRAREWFEQLDCRIPDDQDFIAELTGVEYDFNSLGKKYVKDKRQLGWSPDLADAFVLTFGTWRGRASKESRGEARGSSRQRVAISDSSYVDRS